MNENCKKCGVAVLRNGVVQTRHAHWTKEASWLCGDCHGGYGGANITRSHKVCEALTKDGHFCMRREGHFGRHRH